MLCSGGGVIGPDEHFRIVVQEVTILTVFNIVESLLGVGASKFLILVTPVDLLEGLIFEVTKD